MIDYNHYLPDEHPSKDAIKVAQLILGIYGSDETKVVKHVTNAVTLAKQLTLYSKNVSIKESKERDVIKAQAKWRKADEAYYILQHPVSSEEVEKLYKEVVDTKRDLKIAQKALENYE